MISERTKAALAAAKRRGQKLGNPNLNKAAKRGTAALKANTRRFADNVRPIIEEIMRAGATSANAIAGKLNERNVRTAREMDARAGGRDPPPFRGRKRKPRRLIKAARPA